MFKEKGFMPNIPVNIRFSFEGVSIAPTKEGTLVTGYYDYQHEHGRAKGFATFKVTLRNMALSR